MDYRWRRKDNCTENIMLVDLQCLCINFSWLNTACSPKIFRKTQKNAQTEHIQKILELNIQTVIKVNIIKQSLKYYF